MSLEQSHAAFPDTRWTLIEAVRQADHPHHEQALETLAQSYWPPIYAYLRRIGRSSDQAVELAQAFFIDVVMERRLFEQADADRGQLRWLVLTALKRYLLDENRRKVGRRGNRPLVFTGLSQEDAILGGDDSTDPERAFDRRWALTVLQDALRRCEAHYRAIGKEASWRAFEARVIRPSLAMSEPRSCEEIARELGFRNAEDVSAAVRLVRKRVLMVLQQVAAETATEVSQQQDEYNRVLALLR